MSAPTSERGDAAAPSEQALLSRKTLFYRFVHTLVRIFSRTYLRLRVEGAENIPARGGAVIAANHQSHLDILVVAAAIDRHVCFVARDTLAESAWLRFTMRGCGAVLVRRGTSDRAALREMAAHLEAGDLLAIYPEGTRTRDGRLGEFKGGALLAARMAGVPIVPTGIRGTFQAWPRGRTLPRPGRVTIRFAPPIDSSIPDALERSKETIRVMFEAL